jgi:ABC-2 type transport system ATP-binding protein
VSVAIEASGLGKRYGRRWALRNTSLRVPAGRVVGLVGSNGAGKTTLLHLAVGLLHASEGRVSVLGGPPGAGSQQLSRVGFVAQDAPLYARMSVADHFRMGARLNLQWDSSVASDLVERLDLDPRQRAGSLSGGERAQLALALAIGKRPELLVLDEPVANLDPLARREFMRSLMGSAADGLSVVLSSHLLSDIERVCDYLIVLAHGEVRLAGDVDALIAEHRVLTGPRREPLRLPADQAVISERHTERQSNLIVRCAGPVLDPAWSVAELGLEELVLAYMESSTPLARRLYSVESPR